VKKNTFLIRLFFTMFLLFVIVTLDQAKKINYNDLKEFLSDDINILKFVKDVNGKSKYIKLFNLQDIDTVAVTNDIIKGEKIENGYRYYPDELSGVMCETSGVITNIKYDGTYEVVILDSNDIKWIYSNLQSIDYTIYSYIKAGDVIGCCDEYYDLING